MSEQTSFEKQMAAQNNSVVFIKNIDAEPFTHEYGGVPYTLHAGESLPFPYPVAMHLAEHLAKKLIRQEAKKKGKLEGNDDRKSVTLYTSQALAPYMAQIVQNRVDRPVAPVVSEADLLKQKTEEIQRTMVPSKTARPEISKKDIVDELKKRGIKFNPRDTRENLLALITADEAKGPQEQQ